MTTDELWQLHQAHEQKCDKRSAAVWGEIRKLERLVYIAVGAFMLFELLLLVFGPELVSAIATGTK